MLGGSLVAGLGTSLVRLELLVLGIGGEPLQGRETENVKEGFLRCVFIADSAGGKRDKACGVCALRILKRFKTLGAQLRASSCIKRAVHKESDWLTRI